jgi:predicted KAP-like P-loop ATPase
MNDAVDGSDVHGVSRSQGDAPITSLGDDRLGRAGCAEALAAEVLAAPVSAGYVMGLTGPWGSGKTSILNMTIEALGDQAIVAQFNPWMFSGAEALVGIFFDEIAKQLGSTDSKLKGLADRLATYGHVLSPLASLVGAGGAVSAAANALDKLVSKRSVLEQRRELRSQLEELPKRLVVILDDVDRLRPTEVLDIVRLVRLVGDFPNVVYLLSFDRGRVEECLGEGDPDRGRAYLEKIVQVTYDVPTARQPDVTSIFLNGLRDLEGIAPAGPFNAEDWQNIFTFVVRPMLSTPRHVRRLLGSLSMTMRLIADEVALADLIGMEAIRVLRPPMFQALLTAAGSLSVQSVLVGQGGYKPGRDPADSPIGPLHSLDPRLAEDICRWLFPAARRYFENMSYGPEWEGIWRRERKVASAAVLRFYLEQQLPEGVVSAAAVDEALSRLTDRERLRELLDTCTPAEMMDVVERLNPTLEELPVDHDRMDADPARVALPLLLDLIPRMPDDSSPGRIGGAMTVSRAGLRLLRRITDDGLRSQVVRPLDPPHSCWTPPQCRQQARRR